VTPEDASKPFWQVSADLLYGQVKKILRRRRLYKVEHRMLCGELDDLKARLQAIGLSGRINTSFVERLNVSASTTQASPSARVSRFWCVVLGGLLSSPRSLSYIYSGGASITTSHVTTNPCRYSSPLLSNAKVNNFGSSVRSVQSNQECDKAWRNRFLVSAELSDCHVTTQIVFVDTFERAQEIANIRPHSFSGIGMHFPDTITIVVTSPLSFGMAHRGVYPNDMVVTLPLIGETHRGGQGETVNMRFQNFASCVRDHSQADLVTFTSHGAHNRWAIIGKCAMSPLFIRPTARRIA
jgi:hypothetical protein